VFQHNALATKVQNQQKAKYRSRNVLQKNGVLTAEDAWAKKAANCYGPVLDRNSRHSTRLFMDTHRDTDLALA
jgi:hypothetical protein